jgi:hypothetical protein
VTRTKSYETLQRRNNLEEGALDESNSQPETTNTLDRGAAVVNAKQRATLP